MTSKHKALIVEDHAATAEDLAEILTALEFDSLIVDNKQDAAATVSSGTDDLCLVVLDLEIKTNRGSLRGHVENGRSLLRDIRRLRPDHVGDDGGHWLPIVVVSGHAREADEAVEAMRDGATDVIQKPLRVSEVSARVRAVLERAGRSTHSCCGVMPERGGPSEGTVAIKIGGPNDGRCRVVINAHAVDLTESSLRLLMMLLQGHQDGRGVHKNDLGATGEKGFKAPTRLRDELRPALGSRDIITNDRHGTYGLVAEVVLAGCDVEGVRKLGNSDLAALAERLAVK